jgi:hypothetical protein
VSFVEKVVCPCLFELLAVCRIVVLRKYQHLGSRGVLVEMPQHFDTVADPQLDVQQHDIRSLCPDCRNSVCCSIELADDLKRLHLFQDLAQPLTHCD